MAVVETGRRTISIPDDDGVLRKYLDWDGVKHLIERAPAIDAEPIVEAHWVYSPCDGVWTTACSRCGYEEIGEHMRKYMGCPMCRAKMTHIECVGHRVPIIKLEGSKA